MLLGFLPFVACSSSSPSSRDDTFALDCPGLTEHVSHVEGFLVVGHRGAGGKAVENTIPSMIRAVQDGANAVEIDLSMTKDGAVVLWHDWDPDSAIAVARASGAESHSFAKPRYADVGSEWRKRTDELTLDELRAHYGYEVDGQVVPAEIPTIEAFVAWAASEPRLRHVFFDIKIPEDDAVRAEAMIPHVLEAVRAGGGAFGFTLMSPYESVWARIGRILGDSDRVSYDVDPGVVVVREGSCEEASSTWAQKRGRGYASTVKPLGWTSESWNTLKALLACDLDARDRSRASGAPVPTKVVAATIDDQGEMECLVDMGVDGLLTDDPALLRAVVDARAVTLE